MSLKITTDATAGIIRLAGRLDSLTAPELDKVLDGILAQPGLGQLVFDLSQLDYISSAGVRCLVRARKAIEPAGGRVAVMEPQPAVRKVLEIIKAIPPGGIFTSVEELDDYLDEMQRKVKGTL